jgi:CheY-like chemotaxis protein
MHQLTFWAGHARCVRSTIVRARVLVVEADHELRRLRVEKLAREGYEVAGAASGREAIRRAEASRPDVVVMDLDMADMSGLELCTHFRRDYPPPAPQVLAISAIGAAEPEAIRKGAATFLQKPFSPDELLAALRALLETPPRRVERAEAERFHAEKDQARAAARAMAEAAVRAVTTREPDTLRRAVHAARWLGGYFEDSTVTLFLPEDGQLAVFASSAEEPLGDEMGLAALRGIAQTVLETGSTLIIPDIADQPWLGVPPHDLGAVVCVPFRYREVAIGTLCLVSPVARELGAADAAILEHIAAQAATSFTGTRVPFLGRSGLISRNSFRRILAIEASAASACGEGITVAVLRMPVDASLGRLLEELPAARTQLAELEDDTVGIAARGPQDQARDAARACAALVRKHREARASAELVIGSPVPSTSGYELLAWAEHLLRETTEAPGRTHVVVEARPVWT